MKLVQTEFWVDLCKWDDEVLYLWEWLEVLTVGGRRSRKGNKLDTIF